MILFWGQSLLGIGHWQRTITIIRACRDIGLPTLLAHGAPLPEELGLEGLETHALPYCYSRDADCKNLVDAAGQELDDVWWQTRAAALLTLVQEKKPRILVTELFPFGRWAFRRELLPVLDYCRQQGIACVASVRDIVQPSCAEPARAAAIAKLVNDYYCKILLHTDPDLIPFSRTFPALETLGIPCHDTGFVTAAPGEEITGHNTAPAPRQPIIVVSAGGGRFGTTLLETMLDVWPHPAWAGHSLWLIAGAHYPAEALATLKAAAVIKENVRFFKSWPRLATLFPKVALSVSQGGYNTVLEVMAARTPCLLVPFAESEQQEQTLRARLLAEAGLCSMIEASAFNAGSLHKALYTVPAPPPAFHLHASGAAVTAAILSSLWRQQGEK